MCIRDRPRHFHKVHLRIADAGQVPREHFDVDLFAAFERDRQAGVVIAIKELEGGSFDRRNEDGDGAGGKLPQSRGTLLLHVGMRREVLKGKHVVCLSLIHILPLGPP